jgi:hypothetical protein
MVRKISDNGGIYHEPPYTEEEAESYRRVGGGPVSILHASKTAFVPSPKSPKDESKR